MGFNSRFKGLTLALDGGGWLTPRLGRLISVPIVEEVGWAPGTVWMGAENLASRISILGLCVL